MTSPNWNIFRVAGLLCGEFTGHRWIPLTKVSDAEWFETPLRSSWHHCNACFKRCDTWWRYDMEMISTFLAHCEGNPLVIGVPVMRKFLCFLCCQHEQTIEQANEVPVIWYAMTLLWVEITNEYISSSKNACWWYRLVEDTNISFQKHQTKKSSTNLSFSTSGHGVRFFVLSNEGHF